MNQFDRTIKQLQFEGVLPTDKEKELQARVKELEEGMNIILDVAKADGGCLADAESVAMRLMNRKQATGGMSEKDCASCLDDQPNDACPKSERECGHHCNHAYSHDECCWCGEQFGEVPTDNDAEPEETTWGTGMDLPHEFS